MRHLPYFTELAALDDNDASWRAVSAGLVTLRLVDAWAEEGSAVVAADGWGVRSVRAAIEEMPAGLPARAILSGVVDALIEARSGDMHAVAARLMAYARSLDLDAKWALAADVYETVLAHVHPVEESDVVVTAHLRSGFCQRNLGQLDEAAASYERATRLADRAGDLMGVLRAQIGVAKIALARGNMPAAGALLDETIRAAEEASITEVHALALQERSTVAGMSGQYDLAIQLAYKSLEATTDPMNHDRLLSDIATSFNLLGVRSAARDAYLVLEATAREQYQRWAAAINLMELAAVDGSMPMFERYRRTLADAPLPPMLAAQYHLHVGMGHTVLNDIPRAKEALTLARRCAETYGFHQLVFQIDEAMSRTLTADIPRSFEPVALTEALQEIATDMRRRRELVHL